jgi:serine/threonine-protein kinase
MQSTRGQVPPPIKARQNLGKYRIQRKLGAGGFMQVWQALDTVEGIQVALRIPHQDLLTPEMLKDLRKEVRLTAGLDHPNILPIKNAEFIDDRLVVAYPLGEKTLGDRMQHRMTVQVALEFAEQLLEALDYAHTRRIIHCDVKPENLILFPGNRLCLTDFGISRVAAHTLYASGSGTVGYVAPEQAMGRPSFRSDVFSAGLVIYRMLTGSLPEWPYTWPFPGHSRLQKKVHPDMIAFLHRALQVDHRKRYRDACQMLAAFWKILPRMKRFMNMQSRGRKTVPTSSQQLDWRQIRIRQFQARFRTALKLDGCCEKCHGPVADSMNHCPWCGSSEKLTRANPRFPDTCPRCHRGRKLDWHYCPWCYGPGFDDPSPRKYTDKRYEGRCANPSCERKVLMPFMRYCPWCRTKVKKPWKLGRSKDRCQRCEWPVAKGFWEVCPWCGKKLALHGP